MWECAAIRFRPRSSLLSDTVWIVWECQHADEAGAFLYTYGSHVEGVWMRLDDDGRSGAERSLILALENQPHEF